MFKKKWLLAMIIAIPVAFLSFILMVSVMIGGGVTGSQSTSESYEEFNGVYTDGLPMYPEIKGRGQIPDEVAQMAVGVGVKYRLLPSVVISQWAYESIWGRSFSAKNDINFFGITWFPGCPYPQGSARGVGGSEGGWYMKFPNAKASFNYYGYMVASQNNFNACVNNKNPGECLLILGRGGYAAAGITISSPYYTGCMSIISSNNLIEYDQFAISKWGSYNDGGTSSGASGIGNVAVLESVLGQQLNNGECYGLTAYYVEKMGGPQLMGSGFMYAEKIGSDYDWGKYGWEVIFEPKLNQIKAGDIINWYGGGNVFRGPYGHTGVIISVQGDQLHTYEQNAGQGRICAKYTRPYSLSRISSIVRKVRK